MQPHFFPTAGVRKLVKEKVGSSFPFKCSKGY